MAANSPNDTSEAPAGASAAAEESDDAIIADLVAQQRRDRDQAAEPDEAESPSAATKPAPKDEGKDEADEEPDEEDLEEGEEEGDEAGGHSKSLAEARAALEAGDIRKACKLAFGKVPEFFEVNAKKWEAFRYAQRAERKKMAESQSAFAKERESFQSQVQQVVQQLQPAAAIIQAQQAYQRDRDPLLLVKLVEQIAGAPFNEVSKSIIQGQKLNPAQSRLERQVEELQRQLQERQKQDSEAQRQAAIEQGKQNDLAIIRTTLKNSPVSELPNFADRVYKVLLNTRAPDGRLTLDVEGAARVVMRAERKRVKESPFYKKLATKAAPAAAPSAAKKPAATATPLRRDSQNNGAPIGEETDDDIIRDIQSQMRRARLASEKR